MLTKLFISSLAVTMLVFSSTVRTQTLQERLEKFTDDFAKGYVGPFVDAFGAGLNSGWYHNADVSDGLDLYIGARVMLLPIPSDAKTFSIASPYSGVVQRVPTVFGAKEKITIDGSNALPPGAEPTTYPQGFGVSMVPFAVPHISAGNIFGTRAMLRFFPKTKLGDFGEFQFFGIGAQHSISRYIPLAPVDISALLAYQSMSLGDLVSTTAFTLGAQASKTFAIVTLYGGLGYETSSMEFKYTASYTDPTPPNPTRTKNVSLDVSAANTVRATVGFTLSLAFLKINADYSLAAQPVLTAGIGIGI